MLDKPKILQYDEIRRSSIANSLVVMFVRLYVSQKGENTMKKFISLTLVVILALALCLPVAARYIHCPYCWDGKVLRKTSRTFTGTTYECPNDSSMVDKEYHVVVTEYCNNCDYSMVIDDYFEHSCKH